MPFDKLIQALQSGATVITPTQRLQRELLRAYAHSNTHDVLPRPQCYAYTSWLETWYTELFFQQPSSSPPLLLNDWQWECIWTEMAISIWGRRLRRFEVQQTLQAVKNCALVEANPEGSDFLYVPAAEQFQKLYFTAHTFLRDNDLLAPHELPAYLNQKPYPLDTTKIIWACFDCIHPQQASLQKQLQSQGIKQDYFDIEAPRIPGRRQALIASDDEQETEQLIAWIQEQQAQGAQRIGVVIPDLTQQQARLSRRLKQHFPEHILHFSLGRHLLAFPMIQHALSLFKLSPQQRITREQSRVLFHSPFIQGFFEEGSARARFYQRHVIFQEPEVSLLQLKNACQKQLPVMYQLLDTLKTYPHQASPTDWMHAFSKRLVHFGFPGQEPLVNSQHALLQSFYLTLEQLQTIEPYVASWSFETAFDALEDRCQNQIHQAPQNYNGVHIMGWFESSGFCGDALWIAHMQSHLLPQGIVFSPYLPIPWQKKLAFPRTQRGTEQAMAQTMLERLIYAHDNVVISYAEHINQEPQWPSTLFPNWPAYRLISTTVDHPDILESFEDPTYWPIQPEESIKGGSHLLSLQAQCPFQAFASYRLQTQSKTTESIGLDAREKGSLLHLAMQLIWTDIPSQLAMRQMSTEERIQHIDDCIEKALTKFKSQRPYSMDPLYSRVEHQRLQKLVMDAIEFDLNRPPFQIAGLEKTFELSLDDWTFQLRYDRLDALEDGSSCLIDYKTNIPSPLPWTQERPVHPQMLMYAIANCEIKSLYFLSIKQDDVKASGIGDSDTGITGVRAMKEPWTNLQQAWLSHLQNLLIEFKSGHFAATPIASSTCQQCIHQDLCRITNT
jgi:ATP-dependent helicase/nuclease subunit B